MNICSWRENKRRISFQRVLISRFLLGSFLQTLESTIKPTDTLLRYNDRLTTFRKGTFPLEPTNPYSVQDYQAPATTVTGQPVLNRSIVVQIRVIAILMIVHGSLCVFLGIGLAILSVFLPSVIIAQQQKMPPQPNGVTPPQMQLMLVAIYGGMAAAGIIPGLLQIIAGIANLRLKGRVFGIVALVSGMLSVGTCYCTPTAVGLLVYGLIIYLNETTKQVFALGREGKSWREIEEYRA
jgi:hypothetical protein